MAEDMMNEDDIVVVMTDEAGNEYYYREEMIIPVGDEKYALLVGIHDEAEEHAHPGDRRRADRRKRGR